MYKKCVDAENEWFRKRANEKTSFKEFAIYEKVKERMLMDDVLLNMEDFAEQYAKQTNSSPESILEAVKGVRLLEVYNSYRKIRESDNVEQSAVFQAFEQELTKKIKTY